LWASHYLTQKNLPINIDVNVDEYNDLKMVQFVSEIIDRNFSIDADSVILNDINKIYDEKLTIVFNNRYFPYDGVSMIARSNVHGESITGKDSIEKPTINISVPMLVIMKRMWQKWYQFYSRSKPWTSPFEAEILYSLRSEMFKIVVAKMPKVDSIIDFNPREHYPISPFMRELMLLKADNTKKKFL